MQKMREKFIIYCTAPPDARQTVKPRFSLIPEIYFKIHENFSMNCVMDRFFFVYKLLFSCSYKC